jgi:hypothetical protein
LYLCILVTVELPGVKSLAEVTRQELTTGEGETTVLHVLVPGRYRAAVALPARISGPVAGARPVTKFNKRAGRITYTLPVDDPQMRPAVAWRRLEGETNPLTHTELTNGPRSPVSALLGPELGSELNGIFAMIDGEKIDINSDGDKTFSASAAEGLERLYDFSCAHPTVDVQTLLSTRSSGAFQRFVNEGLTEVEAARAAHPAAAAAAAAGGGGGMGRGGPRVRAAAGRVARAALEVAGYDRSAAAAAANKRRQMDAAKYEWEMRDNNDEERHRLMHEELETMD